MIASFGPKVFQVSSRKVLTFNNLTISGALLTEKQDVEGKKPSTYIKGPDLENMSLDIPLNAAFGVDIREEYNSWVKIRNSTKAHPFILGGNKLGDGNWLLKSVSLRNMEIGSRGVIQKAMLQLVFEEFVRAGSKEEAPGIMNPDISALVMAKLFEPDTVLIRANPNINLE